MILFLAITDCSHILLIDFSDLLNDIRADVLLQPTHLIPSLFSQGKQSLIALLELRPHIDYLILSFFLDRKLEFIASLMKLLTDLRVELEVLFNATDHLLFLLFPILHAEAEVE